MTSPNPPFEVQANELSSLIKIEVQQEVHSAAPIITCGEKEQN